MLLLFLPQPLWGPQAAASANMLAVIYHRFPPAISSTQTLAPVPSPVADYFFYFALMRARSKQSDAAMPEMAAHFEQRLQMYEQIFESYWGEGE